MVDALTSRARDSRCRVTTLLGPGSIPVVSIPSHSILVVIGGDERYDASTLEADAVIDENVMRAFRGAVATESVLVEVTSTSQQTRLQGNAGEGNTNVAQMKKKKNKL